MRHVLAILIAGVIAIGPARADDAVQQVISAQIEAFRGVPSSFVVDAMGGRGALGPEICPVGDGRDLHAKTVIKRGHRRRGAALIADINARARVSFGD